MSADFSWFFIGFGVDEEILEEDLRTAGRRRATLGPIVGLDVNSVGGRSDL